MSQAERVIGWNGFAGIPSPKRLLFVPRILPLRLDEVERVLSAVARHRARNNGKSTAIGQWRTEHGATGLGYKNLFNKTLTELSQNLNNQV